MDEHRREEIKALAKRNKPAPRLPREKRYQYALSKGARPVPEFLGRVGWMIVKADGLGQAGKIPGKPPLLGAQRLFCQAVTTRHRFGQNFLN